MDQQNVSIHAVSAEVSNPLGIAGFVCSLVGLVSGGLLSPVGLILSLVALNRQPKGFAIAGVVLGAIGSCGIVLMFVIFGAAIVAMVAAALGLAVAAIILNEPEKIEITADMANIAIAVEAYKDENRYAPAELAVLGLEPAWLSDPWGTAYAYHLQEDPPGYDLESAGPDGQFGTEDDIRLSTLDEVWSANAFNIKVEDIDDTGSVRITLGDKELIRATGSDDEGRVTINLGDRVLEIVGDDKGGTVQVITPETPASTPPPATAPEGN